MKNDFLVWDVPFVLFRLPDDNKIYFLKQQNTELYLAENFEKPGFYVAPFDFSKHPVLFMPIEMSHMQTLIPEDLGSEKNLSVLEEKVLVPNHENKIVQSIEKIRVDQSLTKLVISNRLDLELNVKPGISVFKGLVERYSGSFVYYWYHPALDFQMTGASPEKLFEFYPLGSTDIYMGETVSLAGTKFDKKQWSEKEYEEQKIVTDYIKRTLFELKLAVSASGPYDYRQGHLTHLRTDLTVMFPNDFSISRILKSLHPTPAVAGLPTEKAIDYISEIEGYDRRYYTGFMGFRTENKGIFHVNLRCMEVFDNKLSLYAGGGITEQSNPADEWNEVQKKWEILKSIF